MDNNVHISWHLVLYKQVDFFPATQMTINEKFFSLPRQQIYCHAYV